MFVHKVYVVHVWRTRAVHCVAPRRVQRLAVIHSYNHTFIHSHIRTFTLHTFIHAYIHTFVHSKIHTCKRPCMHERFEVVHMCTFMCACVHIFCPKTTVKTDFNQRHRHTTTNMHNNHQIKNMVNTDNARRG